MAAVQQVDIKTLNMIYIQNLYVLTTQPKQYVNAVNPIHINLDLDSVATAYDALIDNYQDILADFRASAHFTSYLKDLTDVHNTLVEIIADGVATTAT